VSRTHSIELTDGLVKLKRGSICTKTVKLEDLARAIAATADRPPLFPGVIPETVRWVEPRGPFMCVVTELETAPRTVRWIRDNSPADYGDKVTYEMRRLSMPFIIVPLLFQGPRLVDARLFYRTRRMKGTLEENELYRPNLLNVSDVPGPAGKKTWLCIQYVDVRGRDWYEKVRAVGNDVMFGVFNRSSERHEGHSYYGDSVKDPCDPRVGNVVEWAKATKQDPYFTLSLPWQPADMTVRDIVSELLGRGSRSREFKTQADLIAVASLCPAVKPKEAQ
jgi:hypothetical protein